MKTTKGPADAPKKPNKPARETAEDAKVERALDLDDATWERIEMQASVQSSTPAAVVRRAIEQQYGVAPHHGAVNSGMSSDPRLQDR